jgi:hypothetical protein
MSYSLKCFAGICIAFWLKVISEPEKNKLGKNI